VLARSVPRSSCFQSSAQFDSDRDVLPKAFALFVDVRTRRSVPISAAGDAPPQVGP
jgi:hypothetical protein